MQYLLMIYGDGSLGERTEEERQLTYARYDDVTSTPASSAAPSWQPPTPRRPCGSGAARRSRPTGRSPR